MSAHTFTLILANALILLAVAPCWAWVLAFRTWRKAPRQAATIERLILYGILAIIGVGLGLVGLNYDGDTLLGHNLFPAGFMFVLGAVVLASMDVPAVIFVIGWYRA